MLAHVMYYAWCKHGVLPSTIYALPQNEIEVLKAFYLIEIERNKKG